jgi:exosortase/archaeosortase family protein
MSFSPARTSTGTRGIVTLLMVVWLPVFMMSSQAWRYGDYYDYGWYVPPLAILMFLRRWREMPDATGASCGRWWVVCTLLAPLWLAARVLNLADPFWRLPQWTAAGLAIVTSHFLIVSCKGRGASLAFLPVAAFALTAVPLPTTIETSVVQFLSDRVIGVTAEIFNLFGRPVHAWGNRMESMGEWVEVADGCSGIRSLQGFLMVALFFGEWLRLGRLERGLMLFLSLVCVWLANVARALVLAWLRFEYGAPMFDRWHDRLSLLTFGVAAASAWWLASRLESNKPAHIAVTPPAPTSRPAVSPHLAWVGLAVLAGIELAAWIWMHPPQRKDLPVLEMRYPPPGMEPRFDVAGYEKALPSLRCTTGWMASIGEDRGARRMRAGWFAWDSTDGSSVLEVYHHSPEKCMGAIGWELVSSGATRIYHSPEVSLEFRVTEFKDPAYAGSIHVYKTVWFSNPLRPDGMDHMGSTDALRRLRLAMAWHRFRPHHARVLMGVVAGEEREADAWEQFRTSLLAGLHLQPATTQPPP